MLDGASIEGTIALTFAEIVRKCRMEDLTELTFHQSNSGLKMTAKFRDPESDVTPPESDGANP